MAAPTADTQQRRSAAGPAVAGGAAAAGIAATSAGAQGQLGVAIAPAHAAVAATILTALIAFLARLRDRDRKFLLGQLPPMAQGLDVSRVLAEEDRRAIAFGEAATRRVTEGLVAALSISDDVQRQAAVKGLMEREQRYAQQRSQAMAARAFAAVGRMVLRRDSPLGAFWRIGDAKDHTPGCVFMSGWPELPGRFWPWAVLDRVHPPRHPGCTSGLHSYGEAVGSGWLTAGDVPNVRDAVRAAAGVVMEQQVADGLLAELDVREVLIERRLVDPVVLSGIPLLGGV